VSAVAGKGASPLLSIAGFDPSGGAGVLRDADEFRRAGFQALAVITALTVQVPGRYEGHRPVEPQLLAHQLASLAGAFQPRFIKIGMLAREATVQVVLMALETLLPQAFVVLDPVLGASAGGALLEPRGRAALVRTLLPRVDLVTPNAPELAVLLGREGELPRDVTEVERWLAAFREEFGVDLVLKGGHLPGALHGVDFLATAQGVRAFPAEQVLAGSAHGTGCAFSSALLAGVALGLPLEQAVERAKARVAQILASEGGPG
jgi:hydroxymethylpyrimidine/phosphomethylpyrimidine kinase